MRTQLTKLHNFRRLLFRQATQELLTISLDNHRNRLIQLNVTLAMVSCGVAMSTTITSMFGMNLISGLETHPTAFFQVEICTTHTPCPRVFVAELTPQNQPCPLLKTGAWLFHDGGLRVLRWPVHERAGLHGVEAAGRYEGHADAASAD